MSEEQQQHDQHHSEDELRQHRLDKLARIRERGEEPFAYRFERSSLIQPAREALEAAEAEAGENPEMAPALPAQLAGRMTAFRSHGKSSFADMRDESGKIQVFFNVKTLGADAYETLKDLDIGDFIGVAGEVKRTRKGEITIFAE